MNEFVFEICRIAATLAGLVVAYYVVPALKTVIDRHTDENITGFINAAVYAAEQIYQEPKSGITKKNYVIPRVKNWLNEHGIEITEDQLDILIESAVLSMKTETR